MWELINHGFRFFTETSPLRVIFAIKHLPILFRGGGFPIDLTGIFCQATFQPDDKDGGRSQPVIRINRSIQLITLFPGCYAVTSSMEVSNSLKRRLAEHKQKEIEPLEP